MPPGDCVPQMRGRSVPNDIHRLLRTFPRYRKWGAVTFDGVVTTARFA